MTLDEEEKLEASYRHYDTMSCYGIGASVAGATTMVSTAAISAITEHAPSARVSETTGLILFAEFAVSAIAACITIYACRKELKILAKMKGHAP